MVKEKVLVQEASATEISERAGAIAADAQADLDKALPALAAAVQCLKELKKAHIDEVKALKKPPGGVRLTLEVACVFFEVAPVKKPDPEDPSKKIFDYVEPAGKSLLSNAGKFLEMLQDFDKDNIPDKVRDSALKFPSISQLEVWEDGVKAPQHLKTRRSHIFGVKSGFSMYGPTFLMTLSGMLSLSKSWSISRNLPAFDRSDLPAGST